MKHERKRNRLQGYDYSRDALYFVTSCVKNRICSFGNVVNEIMYLNEFGIITDNQWNWLEEQYPYAILHEHIIMPNHMHGIIEIDHNFIGSEPMKIKSLSELMGAFKTTSSKKIHLSGLKDFLWQRSFHDRIIRDESAFINISNYIRNNPKNWKNDSHFSG